QRRRQGGNMDEKEETHAERQRLSEPAAGPRADEPERARPGGALAEDRGEGALPALWRRLTLPWAADETEARLEHMTKVILVMIGAVFAVAAFVIAMAWRAGLLVLSDLLIMLLLILPIAGGWWLADRGRWRLSRYIPLSLFFMLAVGLTSITGPLTFGVVFFVIAIMLAGMLHGNKVQWAVVGLSIGAYLVAGLIPLGTPLDDAMPVVVTASGSFVGIALLQWFSTSLLNRALAQARANAAKQLRANRALREEITERRRAESQRDATLEALRTQREELQLILDTVPANIWFKDKHNRILRVNRGAAEAMGMPAEAIEGKTAYEVFPDEAEHYYQDDLEVMHSGKPKLGIVAQLQLPSGEKRWVRTDKAPYNDGQGKLAGVLVVVVDITESVRAEEMLRESEARFQSLAESSQDQITLYDRECRHLYQNPAASMVYGLAADEVIGKTHREAGFPEELCDLWEAGIGEVLRTAKPGRSDFEWESAGGLLYLDLRLTPVLDKDGVVRNVLGISRDITEIKRAEEQIKASLREKEVLLREIHHRVGNNMQIVSGLLAMQSRTIEDEKALEAFRESQDRVRSLALLHERLYRSADLARIEMERYIRQLAADLWMAWRVHGISLQVEAAGIVLDIDRAIPCALLMNELVTNSLRHAFPSGLEADQENEIRISMRLDEGKMVLTVSDNGVGLPADWDLADVNTLGLGLVENLIGQIDGVLELDKSRGTTFRITFPAP
ncbi:MAG: PAS domain S-box protein, partial [Anaerolineales bacterium]|nr:PAS domain S-box protein [Anaerolineales bacterium]